MASAAATAARACSTKGLASALGYSAFGAGVLYGLIRRQSVANSLAAERAKQIEDLEKIIAEKDAILKAHGLSTGSSDAHGHGHAHGKHH